MTKEFKFDAIGRDIYPEEIELAKEFNEKYSPDKMTNYQNTDYYGSTEITRRKTPARLSVPAWLYENAPNIVKRVNDVEVFMAQHRFVEQPLRVSVTKELFDKILQDEYVKRSTQYYVLNPDKDMIDNPEPDTFGKRWVRLCKTLFVEE